MYNDRNPILFGGMLPDRLVQCPWLEEALQDSVFVNLNYRGIRAGEKQNFLIFETAC